MFFFLFLLQFRVWRKNSDSSRQQNKPLVSYAAAAESAARASFPCRHLEQSQAAPFVNTLSCSKSSLEMQKHFSAQVERFIMFNPGGLLPRKPRMHMHAFSRRGRHCLFAPLHPLPHTHTHDPTPLCCLSTLGEKLLLSSFFFSSVRHLRSLDTEGLTPANLPTCFII